MITLSEAPSGTGILGGFVAISSINNLTFPVEPSNIRSISSGTVLTNNWGVFNNYGTCATAFDAATGVFTVPATGFYDITILFSIAVDDTNNFNNTYSQDVFGNPIAPNPNGFMGNGGIPSSNYSITGAPQTLNFEDFFGMWGVCISTPGVVGSTVICFAQQVVTNNTSVIQLSATYTGRPLTSGTTWVARTLNKTKNAIVGRTGNSFHFTVTHLK